MRNCPTEEMPIQFLAMLRDLRQRPELNGAALVAIVEGDYSVSLTLDFKLAATKHRDEFGPVHFMYECDKNPLAPGVWKSKNGGGYRRAIETYNRTGRIRVWIGLIQPRVSEDEKTALELLWEQLHNFELCVRRSKHQEGSVRTHPDPVYSGKASGPDDLAVALMQAAYWAAVFMISPRYASSRNGRAELLKGMSLHPRIEKHASDEQLAADRQFLDNVGIDPIEQRVADFMRVLNGPVE